MSTIAPVTPIARASERLSPDKCLQIYDLMLRARVLEERLITMYKQGDGYFWIGGPGEEAFNVPLGLLVDKGQGVDHDYLHLHYRSSATLLAMGADPVDSLRQMKNTATDPYSRGRNFAGHYSMRKWNVAPVSSPIEVQYSIAIGTAMAQRKAKGISIVQGGDAGTAEGDFATALVWSSRKGCELPLLMIVTNNRWGISTSYEGQHGYEQIAERGRAFGMPVTVVDGNDPEASYEALEKAIDYVRTEKKPYLLEAMVSRLRGHSSASGANFVKNEVDCLEEWEKKLEARGLISRAEMAAKRDQITNELAEASKRVRSEPQPEGSNIWDYVFADKNIVAGEE
ncbi:MAG: thiamine pyrophosphate-dependent dehydrogenase E1 component subunit alpha [Deltaproteobacteria bacterium]|nr:thiamine pyrophosphate-dependent dehydrogenase E1 component subunit alpha [Deltaproteobacteria bacterium]